MFDFLIFAISQTATFFEHALLMFSDLIFFIRSAQKYGDSITSQ